MLYATKYVHLHLSSWASHKSHTFFFLWILSSRHYSSKCIKKWPIIQNKWANIDKFDAICSHHNFFFFSLLNLHASCITLLARESEWVKERKKCNKRGWTWFVYSLSLPLSLSVPTTEWITTINMIHVVRVARKSNNNRIL